MWNFAGTREGNLMWDKLCIYDCQMLWGLFLLIACKNVFPPNQVRLEWSFHIVNFHFFILCNEAFYCPAKLSCGNPFYSIYKNVLLFSHVRLEQVF